MSSEAAVAANYTRKVRAAAAEMAATYGDAKYDLLDDLIVPYLVAAVGEGGRVADLLGGGRSAKALTAAGLRVVSVDDLRLYTKKGEGGKGWPRDFARDVAQHIANEAGSEHLVIGDASKVLDEVDAFYFDGMGPLGPETPAGKFLSEVTRHLTVRHVVVTYMASRITGMGDVSEGSSAVYHLAARATAEQAGLLGVTQTEYRSGNVSMGVLVGCTHAWVGTRGRQEYCSASSVARWAVRRRVAWGDGVAATRGTKKRAMYEFISARGPAGATIDEVASEVGSPRKAVISALAELRNRGMSVSFVRGRPSRWFVGEWA